MFAHGRSLLVCATLLIHEPPGARHVPARMLAGGFGKGGGGGKGGKGEGGGFGKSCTASATTLGADAAAMLERAGGNLDRAQAAFFHESVVMLQRDEPALFAKMGASAQPQPPSGDVHEKLVELTWDTIAAFMPLGGGTPAEVLRRLRLVAQAAAGSQSRTRGEGRGASVLDVGCGDGAALPYLCKAGAEEGDYVGLDLSSRMILSAREARGRGGATFDQGSFLSAGASSPPSEYDAVLFNGALQFFADPADALRRAAALLPREGGRVVLAHVNGAAFVREEAAGNPITVLSLMPSLDWLRAQAPALGMELLGPEQLGVEAPDGPDAALDGFYLVVLQRKRA